MGEDGPAGVQPGFRWRGFRQEDLSCGHFLVPDQALGFEATLAK